MRPSRLIRFLAFACLGTVLLVLVAPGCGRSSLEPESADGGLAVASCGPSTCPNGCCDSAGVCRAGRDVRACGSIGGRCSDCVANGFGICTSSRVCGRDDPACSPATCLGCCSTDEGRRRCLSGTEPAGCGPAGSQCSNCTTEGRVCDAAARTCSAARCNASNCKGCCVGDKCLTGDSAAACGASGAQCDSCGAGQVCRVQSVGGGRCEGAAACGPANCGGCCTASGQCVTGNDTTACGKQGEACAACGFNQICVPPGLPNAKSCQVQAACGPSNCPGCCVGNQCVVATTGDSCGINGQECKACGQGMTCNPKDGTCMPGIECTGCLIGTTCAQGWQDTACGFGGEVCNNCTSQGRLCQNNSCQAPDCNPKTCPTGCCDGNTCVTGTQDQACGKPGGQACQDCTASGDSCQAGACVAKCGPSNCTGCCRADGTCSTSGVANSACGAGGVACANCTAQGSFCNGLVVPRRCNSAQSTCPALYKECAPAVKTPVTAPLQKVCPEGILNQIGTACESGFDSPTCALALAGNVPAACATCLAPFKQPFEQSAGLWACAASFVDAACQRQTGCAADCARTSCTSCTSTTVNQCFALVSGNSNQCGTFFNGASCADKALEPGELCSQFSYSNYGQWLRAVGDHYCGNGP